MDASRERGAAAVEFALIIPLLLMFLLGIVEGGTRYAQQSEVNHWAFVAARDLSIAPTKDPVAVVNSLKGGDPTSYLIAASPGGPGTYCAAGRDTVTVTVEATKPSPSGMFGSYTLRGKGVARCEN